jgi:hypothetical protein
MAAHVFSASASVGQYAAGNYSKKTRRRILAFRDTKNALCNSRFKYHFDQLATQNQEKLFSKKAGGADVGGNR